MEIVLCCSFSPLTINYDYFGLSTFDSIVDRCVFFNNGIDLQTVVQINNQFTGNKVQWTDYAFTNFSKMRNDLIASAFPTGNGWVLMIDDTYLINCSFSKNEIKLMIQNYDAATFLNSSLNQRSIKLFRADSWYYILRHNEIIKSHVQEPKVLNLEIELLDLPDIPKSTFRARQQILWLKQDLMEWNQDIFVRTHIIYYLGIANALLENWRNASCYFKSIIDSKDVPHDSWFYKQSCKKYQTYYKNQ